MMDLLTPHVEFLAKTDPSGMRFMWSAPGDRFPLPGDVALRYWREAIDLLGTWLGLVRTRYVVPGRDGRPEERLTEGRRP